MKLPGEATLELRLEPLGPADCQARLLVSFLPRGLTGLAYWYGVWPLHQHVFAGLLNGLARAAGGKLPGQAPSLRPPRSQCLPSAAGSAPGATSPGAELVSSRSPGPYGALFPLTA